MIFVDDFDDSAKRPEGRNRGQAERYARWCSCGMENEWWRERCLCLVYVFVGVFSAKSDWLLVFPCRAGDGDVLHRSRHLFSLVVD